MSELSAAEEKLVEAAMKETLAEHLDSLRRVVATLSPSEQARVDRFVEQIERIATDSDAGALAFAIVQCKMPGENKP